MDCQPTQTPALTEDELAVMRARYRVERDKRVTRSGHEQYERPSDDFAEAYEHDPYVPIAPRPPVDEDLDVAILGGGWTGVLAGYHLAQEGVSTFRHIDHAGDFGGVWYWNRYPGVHCDNDAYCYLPLLEEMGFMPSKKFSDGYEIQAYMTSIAERFSFFDKALLHTLVTGLRWEETIRRWRITTNRGDEIRARFVIMAGGLMNMPKLPGIRGLHNFTGKMFHTARWDYCYTGGSRRSAQLTALADQRVAIVGTGATAIQAIPHIAAFAKQLYVLQRTPSNIDYYPVFNQPNVKLIDVSATQGVEAMTERGFIAEGQEHEIDCLIVASGFELTSDLERRWGIRVIEGRGGLSIYDHWREGPSTFHGVITDGFPNMFYTGFIQTATNSSTTEQFRAQVEHISHIIARTMAAGAEAVEPSVAAVAGYVAHMREMEFGIEQFLKECTPSYYNNEGEDRPRWALIRGYKPGWNTFMKMLAEWREQGSLEGLELFTAA